ncbi:MAG: hypothetical protein OK455_01735 [Thaumarchaeota archaeon]|nr:hypothetical protein [Nitrososphaerota archaeon]
MKLSRTATTLLTASTLMMALLVSIPTTFAAVQVPSGNVLSVDTLNTSATLTFTLSQQTKVDIGVADAFQVGDYYSATLDGNPLFTTATVPQATSLTVCTESPPGNLASCAPAQSSGDVIQTGLGVLCTGDGFNDLAVAHAAGLSVGDAVVTLSAGPHTIVVSDIAPVFLNSFDSFAPSSFCLDIHSPPSFGIPEFSTGALLVAATLFLLFAMISSKFGFRKNLKEGLALG